MFFGGDFNIVTHISNTTDIIASADIFLINGECLLALSYQVIHESDYLHE